MNDLIQMLDARGLSQTRLDEVRKAIGGLAVLDDSLKRLIAVHDRWQGVDIDLRRIEALVDRDIDELKDSWEAVSTTLRPLCDGDSEPWAMGLRADTERITHALASGTFDVARQAFRAFRSRAATRFYQVDASLKRLCDDLRRIGGPLTELVSGTPFV